MNGLLTSGLQFEQVFEQLSLIFALLSLQELDLIGNCHLYVLYPLDLEKRGLLLRPLPRPRPLGRPNCLQGCCS